MKVGWRFFLIMSFFLVCYQQIYPQQNKNKQFINDSIKFKKALVFYKKAVSLFPNDISRAIYYNKNALKLVDPKTRPILSAKVNKLMGDLYSKNSNLQPAINYYLISAKVFKHLNNRIQLCKIYQKLGELYYRDNYNLKNALNYYTKALSIAASLNNNNTIAEIYNRIGGILYNQKNFEEASSYFNKALLLWQDQNNYTGIARAYNNIGEIYKAKKEYNKANEYYLKSLKINKKSDNKLFMAINYENLGTVKAALGLHKTAYKLFLKSMALYQEVSDVENTLNIKLLLGKEYDAQKKYKSAFKVFSDVFTKAKNQNNWELMTTSAKELSKVFEHSGNLLQALHYFKIYSQYNDSINFKKQRELLTDLQARFLNDIKEKELSIKDKEIALLQSDKKVKQLQNSILITGFIMLIIISALLISRYKSQFHKERILSIKNKELHETQKKLMELEIKSKNNDLANFALHIVEKNNFLRNIRKQLKLLNNYSEEEKTKKINELIVTVHQNLQIQEELEKFHYKVEQTYQGFFERLKEKLPTITKNEERLCALLRLNLSSKEIAALNNISVKAVEMSRYRLRKKCKISNNENLCDYLENI